MTEKVHKKSIKVLELQFSSPVNASDAGNLAAYSLESVTTNKKHHTITKPIPLTAASYSAATSAVILAPRGKLPNQTMQLTVIASLIEDANGHSLAGTSSGQPGTNFTATLNSRGVLSRSEVRATARIRAVSAEAFDALMVAGRFSTARRSHHPREAENRVTRHEDHGHPAHEVGAVVPRPFPG